MTEAEHNTLSRRGMLKLMGATAGTAVLSGCAIQQGESGLVITTQAPAQPIISGMETIAYYNFTVGDFQVTAISDAMLDLEATNFGVNASLEEINDLLVAFNLPPDMVKATVTCMLVDTGEDKVLLDTGMGDANPQAPGKLIDTLAVLGLTPADITVVAISHFHFDHISAAALGGEVAFPNAQYYFPQTEWDFLQNAPTGTPFDDLIAGAQAKMQPALDNEQVVFYEDEAEIVTGIQTIPAFGHTPGHSIFQLESNGETLLNMVDTANHALLALTHPEWHFGFDALPDVAVETRRTLYGRAADEKIKVFGYHFPFPGIGYVIRNGDGFQYTPTG